MTKHETLYKRTKTGATQICNIAVDGATVITEFGQLGGKMQISTDTCTAKNVGRSNETTPEQQAVLEAQSKFNKKVKEGYSTELTETPTVLLPQKVKSYNENSHLVTYPCYIQPKYNGVNGTYWLAPDGSLKLTSRGGEEFHAIPHLEEEVLYFMRKLNTTCLNGELFIPGESLQQITSAVKKPKELSKRLMFIIFELPKDDRQFSEKYDSVFATFSKHDTKHVTLAPTTECDSESMLSAIFQHCIDSNLEGIVIYNADAEYKFNERSSSVLKLKPVLDAEFKILSYTLDRNGHPVFTCETPDGKPFKVKPKGTDEERKQIVADFESKYKNNYYTVEYEMLSDSGIPLKGIGIGLRAVNDEGEANE